MRPTSGVYANNNSEYYNAAYPFLDNPVAAMNGDLTGMNTSRGRSLQSTATLTYDVPWVKGLKAKLMTSYDASDNRTSHERKLYQCTVIIRRMNRMMYQRQLMTRAVCM